MALTRYSVTEGPRTEILDELRRSLSDRAGSPEKAAEIRLAIEELQDGDGSASVGHMRYQVIED